MVINVVDPNKPVVKKIPQLAFKKTEATMFLGSTGKMNELIGVPDGATVKWDADSKYDIAEIDQSGNITPNATGDVLVTAYTSETDEYQVGHISYKLHIISVNGTYTVDKSEWSDSRYTITSNTGYKLREIDNPVNTDALSVDVNDGEEKEDTYQFLVVDEATNTVSAPQSITYKIDKKAPTATIRCSNKTWSEYSYGKLEPTLSPTGTVVVKIDATDNGSGVKNIKYGITPYLYGKNQVDLMVNVHDDGPENGWHTYNPATGIVLKPNSQNVVYAKITDNVGHETIICSTTIVTYNAGDMNYPDGDADQNAGTSAPSQPGNTDQGTSAPSQPGNTDQGTSVSAQPELNVSVSGIKVQNYTGKAITPKVKVKDAATGKKLTQGKQYSVSYENNVDAGTGTIVLTGINGYEGVKKVNFTIQQQNVAKKVRAKIATKKILYTGEAVTPAVNVTYNKMALVEGRDYELSYANNVAKVTATVYVTGKGNYTGTKAVKFKISGPKIKDAEVSLTADSAVYSGTNSFPGVIVKYH